MGVCLLITPAGRTLRLVLGELCDHDNLIRRIAIAVALPVSVPIESSKILFSALLVGENLERVRGIRQIAVVRGV